MLPPLKVVHVEEAKTAAEKVKNASREGEKGVWNRQGRVILRVANPVVVSTVRITLNGPVVFCDIAHQRENVLYNS